jgi:hypothetical protein
VYCCCCWIRTIAGKAAIEPFHQIFELFFEHNTNNT